MNRHARHLIGHIDIDANWDRRGTVGSSHRRIVAPQEHMGRSCRRRPAIATNIKRITRIIKNTTVRYEINQISLRTYTQLPCILYDCTSTIPLYFHPVHSLPTCRLPPPAAYRYSTCKYRTSTSTSTSLLAHHLMSSELVRDRLVGAGGALSPTGALVPIRRLRAVLLCLYL